jgi:hypothetical protein
MLRNLIRGGDCFLPLFVVSFVLKVAYSYLYYDFTRVYTAEMAHATFSICRGDGIADIFASGSGPSAHVAPLYPYYLAGLSLLFGEGLRWILVCQLSSLAAASASIALLPGLARICRSPLWVGYVAAGFLALSPFGVIYEKDGNWETSFSALGLVLAFRILARLEQAGRSLLLVSIAAGALSGLLALLSTAVAPAILGCALACGAARRAGLLRTGLAFGLSVLTCALVISPWCYRNYCVLGGLVPVRSNFGLELYIGNHSGADGYTYGARDSDWKSSIGDWHPILSSEELNRYKELGELAYMRERGALAESWIRQNPSAFAHLTWLRFQYYWFPPPRPGIPVKRSLWFGLLSAGAFSGAFYLVWVRHPFRWHFLSLLLGPSLAYMVTHIDLRYRYPTLWVSAFLTAYVLGATAIRAVRMGRQARADTPPAAL